MLRKAVAASNRFKRHAGMNATRERHDESGHACDEDRVPREEDEELWAQPFDDGSASEEQPETRHRCNRGERKGLLEGERCRPSSAGAKGLDDPIITALLGDERVGGECDDRRPGKHANAHHELQRLSIDARCPARVGVVQPLSRDHGEAAGREAGGDGRRVSGADDDCARRVR